MVSEFCSFYYLCYRVVCYSDTYAVPGKTRVLEKRSNFADRNFRRQRKQIISKFDLRHISLPLCGFFPMHRVYVLFVVSERFSRKHHRREPQTRHTVKKPCVVDQSNRRHFLDYSKRRNLGVKYVDNKWIVQTFFRSLRPSLLYLTYSCHRLFY